MNPFIRESIENWAAEFAENDTVHRLAPATREYAAQIAARFLISACEARDIEPGDLEETDLKTALLQHLARLDVPASVRGEIPELCAEFLLSLQSGGRMADAGVLAAYVRALKPAFEESAAGKPKPIVNPGSKLGRNDPCPCGSGKKYKKCCMKD